MKNATILIFGKDLKRGDLIAVSYVNWIELGWYIGRGNNNSLQYFKLGTPIYIESVYKQHLINPNKLFNKGFSAGSIPKTYINNVWSNRVIKITEPLEIFTEERDKEDYLKERELLIKLNFIKK